MAEEVRQKAMKAFEASEYASRYTWFDIPFESLTAKVDGDRTLLQVIHDIIQVRRETWEKIFVNQNGF